MIWLQNEAEVKDLNLQILEDFWSVSSQYMQIQRGEYSFFFFPRVNKSRRETSLHLMMFFFGFRRSQPSPTQCTT